MVPLARLTIASVVIGVLTDTSAADPLRVILNQQAAKLVQAGKYADAELLFQDVLRRWPSAESQYNLGLLYLKMKDDEKAVRHFQEYLVRAPKARDRAWVEQQIRECQQRIATRPVEVGIDSAPVGADVFLDGTTRLGRTPLKAKIAPGHHVLRLVLSKRGEILRALHVRQGVPLDVQVSFPKVEHGILVVTANVSGATVEIDGKPALLGENRVAPGIHQVRVAKTDHHPWSGEVRVELGERNVAAAKLTAVPRKVVPVLKPALVPVASRRAWVGGWAALGVSAVSAALGGIWAFRSNSDMARANDLGVRDPGHGRLVRSSNEQWAYATAAFIFSGAAAGASIGLHIYSFLLKREAGSEPATRTVGVRPVPGGMVVETAFGF